MTAACSRPSTWRVGLLDDAAVEALDADGHGGPDHEHHDAGRALAAASGMIQPAWLTPARPMRFGLISPASAENATPAAMSDARSAKTGMLSLAPTNT
jgi:hypothetical protein